MLFTRDLRVHDNPALTAAAAQGERVVPLFVLDDAVLKRFGAPNRLAFLGDALADLDASLRRAGGRLVLRHGNVVAETCRLAVAVGAEAVFLSEDVSAYAQERERRLGRALERERVALDVFPGVTVVPPGDLAPGGRDHYRVFTPYWSRWREHARRAVLPAPQRLTLPDGIDPGVRPSAVRGTAAELPAGGETAGRRRLEQWLDDGLSRYGELADDLGADATSRLSPYLHFGCVSTGEVVARALEREGGRALRPPALLARLQPPAAGRTAGDGARGLPVAGRELGRG